MERGNTNRGKRAREGDSARDSSARSAVKKPDLLGGIIDQECYSFEFDILHAAANYNDDSSSSMPPLVEDGVFDFPWLNKTKKEGGMIFKAEEEEEWQLELEEDTLFASFSSLHKHHQMNSSSTAAVGFDEFSGPQQQHLCQSPNNWLINFQDDKKIEEEEDKLDELSFRADELEGADWIWSSMPSDQPNKHTSTNPGTGQTSGGPKVWNVWPS